MISQSRICKQAASCRLSPEYLLVLFYFLAAECFQNTFQMFCASGIFVTSIQSDPDGCSTRAGINADDVICIDILLTGVYECRRFASYLAASRFLEALPEGLAAAVSSFRSDKSERTEPLDFSL